MSWARPHTSWQLVLVLLFNRKLIYRAVGTYDSIERYLLINVFISKLSTKACTAQICRCRYVPDNSICHKKSSRLLTANFEKHPFSTTHICRVERKMFSTTSRRISTTKTSFVVYVLFWLPYSTLSGSTAVFQEQEQFSMFFSLTDWVAYFFLRYSASSRFGLLFL